MRNLAAVAAFSVLALAAGGCVHTNATVLDNRATRASLAPQDVVIYRTAGVVPGNYEEVALLNSRGDALWTGERGMIEDMREEAARLGANGIILDGMSEPSAAVQVLAQALGTSNNRRGSAIAIYLHPHASLTAAVAPAPVVAPRAPAQPAFLADVSRLPATPPNAPRRVRCNVDPQTGAEYNCREVN